MPRPSQPGTWGMAPPRRAQPMGVEHRKDVKDTKDARGMRHTKDPPEVGMRRRHTPSVNEGLHGAALRWRSSGRGYFPLVQFLPPITPAGPPCARHHCAAGPRACPAPATCVGRGIPLEASRRPRLRGWGKSGITRRAPANRARHVGVHGKDGRMPSATGRRA